MKNAGLSTSRMSETFAAELARNASNDIPFYRDHLSRVESDRLSHLPSFDKSRTAGYGRFPISKGGAAGAFRVVATSGTTGDRLFLAFDEQEWQRTADWLEKVGCDVGLMPSDVLLNTHCYGLWVGGPALDLLASRAGAGLIPVGPAAPTTVLKLLMDGVGSAISATPSYLRRLVEAASEANVDLRKTALRLGFIGAESADAVLRKKLVQKLPEGFRWIELYGLSETGGPSVAAGIDPEVPELELNTQAFFAEVLDPGRDVPTALGEIGELTLTTLRTDGRTPLVRYRTRDLVRTVAGPLEAPTRISRIIGRVDDSLKIGGILVYPSALAEILSEALPPTSEWRAEVRMSGHDEKLVIEAEATAEVCRTLEREFRDRIGVDATVVAVDARALARSRDKTRRILVESTNALNSPGPTPSRTVE